MRELDILKTFHFKLTRFIEIRQFSFISILKGFAERLGLFIYLIIYLFIDIINFTNNTNT
jgi:hypothetical protein